jgi:hypothetical protein
VKHVFLVGCPRSGTTWLQVLLAQHPQVATARETHLFNGYLKYLDQSWKAWAAHPDRVGLKELLSEQEFYELCSSIARGVMRKIQSSNPAATVALEKTPSHVRHVPLILKLLPEAHFIHIVRDPRSTVSSLGAASRSWGRTWASRSVLSNARMWCADVNRGRQITTYTPRVREIRYEDLRGPEGVDTLHGLVEWLELPGGRAFAAQALETCEISRLREGGAGVRAYESIRPNQAIFFRSGTTDGWKQDLTPREIEIIEYTARDLMREYGYALHHARSGRRPFRIWLRDIVDRAELSVRNRTDVAFRKLRAVC